MAENDYNPLVDAPFLPLQKPDEYKGGLEKLKEKIEQGGELDEKERRIASIAMVLLKNAFYDHSPYTPFICGEGGKKGEDGMPEFFFICPNFGLDGFAVYKKDKDYSGPGW